MAESAVRTKPFGPSNELFMWLQFALETDKKRKFSYRVRHGFEPKKPSLHTFLAIEENISYLTRYGSLLDMDLNSM